MKIKPKCKYSPCSFLGDVLLSHWVRVTLLFSRISWVTDQNLSHNRQHIMCIVWKHSIFPTQFLEAVRSPFIKPSHFSSFEIISCRTIQRLSAFWFRVYQTSKDNFPQFLSKINSCDQTKRSFDFFLSWWISILIWFSVIANLIFHDRPLCIASINESFRIFQQNKKSEGLSNVNPWTNIISS